MPSKDFIVAIELGSSKLRGIAGRKNADGSITVSAVASDDSSSYIRKGIVYNIEKTVQSITNIVNKLKATLNREISQVYVGVGGQSILSVKNEIIRDLPHDTVITQQIVNELMDANRNKTYSDKTILDVAIQEYKVGNDLQNDPAGIQADRLTGNFLNILWRNAFYNKLTDCFDRARVKIAELDIAPLALADCILDDTQKRAGCLLVDLGADTTTMLVYHKNILRHIAVIPLGSSNITKDLTSLNIEEDVAERMKKKYGNAYSEPKEQDKTLDYPVDIDHVVSSVKFQQVIEARVQEIIKNVIAQVPLEYINKLNGGIVLTGGGANLKNITTAFRKNSNIEKVVVANFINDSVNIASKTINIPHDGTMNTLLGLLMKGDLNCDGGERNNNIFDVKTETTKTAAQAQTSESQYVAGGTTGVRTPSEIAHAAEVQRKQDTDEWEKALADNTVGAYESYKEKYPGGLHVAEANQKIEELTKKPNVKKGFGKLVRFFKDMVSEEE